jgi:hypothetical protein
MTEWWAGSVNKFPVSGGQLMESYKLWEQIQAEGILEVDTRYRTTRQIAYGNDRVAVSWAARLRVLPAGSWYYNNVHVFDNDNDMQYLYSFDNPDSPSATATGIDIYNSQIIVGWYLTHGMISIHDLSDGSFVDYLDNDLSEGSWFEGVAVYDGKVYATDLTQSKVYVWDLQSRARIATWDLSAAYPYTVYPNANNIGLRGICVDGNGVYISYMYQVVDLTSWWTWKGNIVQKILKYKHDGTFVKEFGEYPPDWNVPLYGPELDMGNIGNSYLYQTYGVDVIDPGRK